MIDADKRKAVFALHQEGMGVGDISRLLGIGRNTAGKIIEQKGRMPLSQRSDSIRIDPELLQKLYAQCDGRAQRVHEKLEEEEGIEVKYSTLTRKLRELGISKPQKSRCDQVPDEPGVEMQHDTTVYTVKLAGKRTRLTASLIYLRYSKRRYLKLYKSFNRFKMKCFFHEALTFWGYCATQCIIDNTNLARLRGTGSAAVIVPEMAAFAKQYGFLFHCHEIGHANRKAGNERSFYTTETNFLPGRTFESLEDINAQAFEWSTVRMEHRPQSKAGIIPAKAFEHESVYLVRLSPHLPKPYLVHDRGTDQYGYTAFEGNYYWVPGTKRQDVTVLEYANKLKIYCARQCVAEYPLPPDGVKNEKFSPPGMPKPRYNPSNRRKPTQQEEKRLHAMGEVVGNYLDFVLKPKGIQRHRFLRRLFALSQKMTGALFIKTIERALRYRIDSLEILERIAVLYMTEGEYTFPDVDVDESLHKRQTYLDGRLTDEPDFSQYEEMLEEKQEKKEEAQDE